MMQRRNLIRTALIFMLMFVALFILAPRLWASAIICALVIGSIFMSLWMFLFLLKVIGWAILAGVFSVGRSPVWHLQTGPVLIYLEGVGGGEKLLVPRVKSLRTCRNTGRNMLNATKVIEGVVISCIGTVIILNSITHWTVGVSSDMINQIKLYQFETVSPQINTIITMGLYSSLLLPLTWSLSTAKNYDEVSEDMVYCHHCKETDSLTEVSDLKEVDEALSHFDR